MAHHQAATDEIDLSAMSVGDTCDFPNKKIWEGVNQAAFNRVTDYVATKAGKVMFQVDQRVDISHRLIDGFTLTRIR